MGGGKMGVVEKKEWADKRGKVRTFGKGRGRLDKKHLEKEPASNRAIQTVHPAYKEKNLCILKKQKPFVKDSTGDPKDRGERAKKDTAKRDEVGARRSSGREKSLGKHKVAAEKDHKKEGVEGSPRQHQRSWGAESGKRDYVT